MCITSYILLFFCLIIVECYALNCRTEGGPKDSELKNIYQKCLKLQNSKNSTNNKNSDQEWKESRGYSSNDRENRDRDRDDNRRSNRNDWMSSTDRAYLQGSSDGWMSNSYGSINNNDRHDGMGSRYEGSSSDGRMSSRYDGSSSDDRVSNRNEGSGSRYDRGGNYDRTSNRNDGMGNDERTNSRNDYYGNHEERERDDHLSGRNDFHSDNYDTNMYQYNGYRSTQSPHRYKRDRRTENTGQRSQYNPNSQRSGYDETYGSDEKNTSENNTKEADNKACALHCFLENLEMTGEDGMPDKYLVTHGITKDVKNEDLRDFLQESIDECFQILDNENNEDKCEFSKDLLLCLSEKGKANCDDWRDDLRF